MNDNGRIRKKITILNLHEAPALQGLKIQKKNPPRTPLAMCKISNAGGATLQFLLGVPQ